MRKNTRAIPAPVRKAPSKLAGTVYIRGSKTPPVRLDAEQMAAYLYAVVGSKRA